MIELFRTVYSMYPIEELGDNPNGVIPIREFLLKSFDGNKFCGVQEVVSGVESEIKTGYMYIDWDVFDESNIIPCDWVRELEIKP